MKNDLCKMLALEAGIIIFIIMLRKRTHNNNFEIFNLERQSIKHNI